MTEQTTRAVIAPHTCAVLRADHVGQTVRLAGWVNRKRDHGQLLFIDLRDHYGITQCVFTPDSSAFAIAEAVRLESVIARRRPRHRRARAENVNPALPTGDVEVVVDRDRGAVGGRDAAVPGRRARRRSRRSSGCATASSICAATSCTRNIVLRSQVIASIRRRMQRAGLSRVPDADPHLELARRRARLPRAEPDPSRQVLRAAAGAAAVQAAADGGGLRPLLPDRALLPRRGRARRSLAGRVLSARRRAVVRHAGRRVRGDRAGAGRRVRGVLRAGASPSRRSRASPTTMRW